jgi:hypothetical protein
MCPLEVNTTIAKTTKKKNNWWKVVHYNYKKLIMTKFKTLKSYVFTLIHLASPHFSSRNNKKEKKKKKMSLLKEKKNI